MHAPSSPTLSHRDAVEAVRALARLARLLEKASGTLGMAQYRVLSAIAAGDERASRVAERLGLGRPAISAAVDALCRDGLLDRRGAPGDQRAVDLALTAAGRAQLAQVEARMAAVLADVVAHGADAGATGALASLGPALEALQRQRHARGTPRA
jgi:DNA-binding MarR family transcriptional regulator